MRQLQRSIRYRYLRFIRLQGDPISLARGTAIGVFIGATPTIPLHTVLIFLASSLLRGNLVAALLSGLAVSNPLTIAPQYFLAWWIGTKVTGIDLSWSCVRQSLEIFTGDAAFLDQIKSFCHIGIETTIVMMTGGLIIALPLAFAGYAAALRFFSTIRRRRYEKHILK